MQIGTFKILAVFDSGDNFLDRYTIVTDCQTHDNLYDCLCLSDDPTHPQGFSQWGSADLSWMIEDHAEMIPFDSLPNNVQEHVRDRLLSDVSENDRYEF